MIGLSISDMVIYHGLSGNQLSKDIIAATHATSEGLKCNENFVNVATCYSYIRANRKQLVPSIENLVPS